jgi:hypothetical protein
MEVELQKRFEEILAYAAEICGKVHFRGFGQLKCQPGFLAWMHFDTCPWEILSAYIRD